jgi:hypothetical protein
LLPDNEAADVQVIEPDDAFGGALVAVRDLPGAAFYFFPGGALCWVEGGVSAISDVVGEEGALHPCVGGSSVEVQLDGLWWSANTDFCNIQGVVFNVLGLDIGISICPHQRWCSRVKKDVLGLCQHERSLHLSSPAETPE